MILIFVMTDVEHCYVCGALRLTLCDPTDL